MLGVSGEQLEGKKEYDKSLLHEERTLLMQEGEEIFLLIEEEILVVQLEVI